MAIIHYIVLLIHGNVPGGAWLLVFLLGVFTFIIWYVVRTSGLLERQKARRLLIRGWIILIAVYVIVWLATRPVPMPKTVLVVPFADYTSEGWLGEAVADEVAENLIRSNVYLQRLSWDLCPLFGRGLPADSVWAVIQKIKPSYAIWGTMKGNKDSLVVKAYYSRTRWGRAVRFSESMQHFHSVYQAGVTISEVARRTALIPKQVTTGYFPKERPFLAMQYLYSSRKKFRDGNMASALDLAVKAVGQDTSWDDSWRMVGQCWDLLDDSNAQGVHAIQEAICLDSADVRNWHCLARYAIRRQQWDYAENALKTATHLKQRSPTTLFLLSHLHPDRLQHFRGLTPEEALRRAVVIYPGFEEARIKYAWMLYGKGDYQDCERVVEEGLGLDDASWELWEVLALTHFHQAKRAAAVEEIQKSVALSDSNSSALYNAGYLYFGLGRLDQAKECLTLSAALKGNSDTYYLLGQCAEQQGDTAGAIHYYQLSSAAPSGDDNRSAEEAVKRATGLVQ